MVRWQGILLRGPAVVGVGGGTILSQSIRDESFPQNPGGNASRHIATALVILSLAGCNGTLPPAPKVTLVPVPVPCLTREQVPVKDFLSDSELAKLDDFQLVISLRTEQLKQRGWIETTSALLEACIK